MKSFIKMTLAVVCGILVVSVITIFLCLSLFGALAAAGNAKSPLPKEGVLDIDMSKIMLCEQAGGVNPASMMPSNNLQIRPIGLWDAVQAINAAAEDPAIKYVYLRPEGMTVQSFAQVEELRAALSKFRVSGKPVIASMEAPSTISYYLGSVADKIYLSDCSGATYMLNGISSSLVFLKDLLDSFDVNIQLVRHGKYKSYGEMFTKNAPSAENYNQTQDMINSLWNSLSLDMCSNRDITPDELNAIVDNLELTEPKDFVEEGLVDELMSREQLLDKLTTLSGKDKYSDVHFISLSDYAAAKVPAISRGKQKIAVIYADGNINMGSSKQEIAGSRFARIIADVRADSTVKAVVLRVNSPGGAVFAAEQIKAELDLLKAQKPLVASYGNYAASGGYWISGNCDKIFSNATTLTGSIGVFGVVPDLSGTINRKFHVNVVSVNSNKHSDMMNLMRPMDKDEYALQQKSVDDIYDRFVDIVSEGRGLDPQYVDSIAQGRVWTGAEAFRIGLVDELGTLEDAVRWARIAASDSENVSGQNDFDVVGYPAPLTVIEQITEMFGGAQARVNPFAGTPLETAGKTILEWTEQWDKSNGTTYVASMPFEMLNK